MPVTLTAAESLLGRQFGPYHIVSPLGAGGMGEVYRAHDSKLGRDVAIKTLPQEFAHDPERLSRLRREARTVASLNHPNIAAIYGLEESEEADYLVLELVEGETLRGPLPVQTALDRACQVAAALEAAHDKGIIHRDLKPANVKVTPQGTCELVIASAGMLLSTTIAGPSHAELSSGRVAGDIAIHPRGAESPTHQRCDAIGGDGRIARASFSGQASPGESRAVIVSVVVTRCVVSTVDPVVAPLPLDAACSPSSTRAAGRCFGRSPRVDSRVPQARQSPHRSVMPCWIDHDMRRWNHGRRVESSIAEEQNLIHRRRRESRVIRRHLRHRVGFPHPFRRIGERVQLVFPISQQLAHARSHPFHITEARPACAR